MSLNAAAEALSGLADEDRVRVTRRGDHVYTREEVDVAPGVLAWCAVEVHFDEQQRTYRLRTFQSASGAPAASGPLRAFVREVSLGAALNRVAKRDLRERAALLERRIREALDGIGWVHAGRGRRFRGSR